MPQPKLNQKKPVKSDIPTDDVTELSRQTSALLEKFGETKITKPKPKLPKKNINIKSYSVKAGAHFDIIPESVPKKNQSIVADREQNKVNSLAKENSALGNSNTPNVIKSHHRPGSLSLIADRDQDVKQFDTDLQSSSKVESEDSKAKTTEVEPATKTAAESKEVLKNSETKQNKVTTEVNEVSVAENKTPDEKSTEENIIPANTKNIEEDRGLLTEEPSHLEDLGYSIIEDDTASTEGTHKSIFDTEEYHVELHDWSKLGKPRTTWLWALLLLAVVAGATFYLFKTGMITSEQLKR